jgi:hypothetical protein
MNEELKRLDLKLAGITPYDFSKLQNGLEHRIPSEYSWQDLLFNVNDHPMNVDTAIIVTSWSGQLGWLKATLTNYRLSGCYVILAFDNPYCAWHNVDDPDYIFKNSLRPVHHLLAHSVITKHKTYDADKRTGWFWNTKYAQAIVNGFPNIKYVYGTNGDCILERPEGIHDLKNILGEGDFISGQSTPGSTIHTACVFYKIEAFNKIMDYMFDRNKFTILGAQSPETMLRDAVNKLRLKETFAKQPMLPDGSVDYYCTQYLPSTWKEVLGFRNLYAEQEYRENNRFDPLPKRYFDPFRDWTYFRDDWRETICKYYETGDKRYLLMWWDRGCDTDTDRRYYPLDHYGKEPILDGSN